MRRSIAGCRSMLMRAVSPHLSLLVTRCVHHACTSVESGSRLAPGSHDSPLRGNSAESMTDRCSFSRLRGSRNTLGRTGVLTLSEVLAYYGKDMGLTYLYRMSSLWRWRRRIAPQTV